MNNPFVFTIPVNAVVSVRVLFHDGRHDVIDINGKNSSTKQLLDLVVTQTVRLVLVPILKQQVEETEVC